MNPSETPLAADFAPATREAWRALVRKALKEAEPDSLASRSADGLIVQPLYAAEEGAAFVGADDGARRGWEVRAGVSVPDRFEANQQIRDALAGGADSILIRLDPLAQIGVAVGSAADLGDVLAGVEIERTPVSLQSAYLAFSGADWLAEIAKASPTAALALHCDPLSELARTGASPGPIDTHVARCAALGPNLVETYPRSTIFLASGLAVHEAGGTEAEELAFAAAAALAYAKALAAAGLAMDEAWGRIVLALAADADAFASIIKLRAARKLWARMTQACGAEAPARIEARSSGRMLTAAAPWTNLVRLTSACFAAAAGGADVIVLGAFTDAIGAPSAFARRMARNTQLILKEEAGLGRVGDPAGGSGYVEATSHQLAAAAWERFQAIEAAGGAAVALQSGLVHAWVQKAREALAKRLGDGQARLLGVTDFAPAEAVEVDVEARLGAPVDAPDPRAPGPDSACPALDPIRLEDLAQ